MHNKKYRPKSILHKKKTYRIKMLHNKKTFCIKNYCIIKTHNKRTTINFLFFFCIH